MNAEALQIIDSALRGALLMFLLLFAFFLTYAWFRLRRKRRRLTAYFEEDLQRRVREQLGDDAPEPQRQPYLPKVNRWRTALHSMGLAALAAVFGFLLLSFAPLPFVHNFAAQRAWRTVPLRLTALQYERFHEGFSLKGEVWNQTEKPIDGLHAVVTIWDHDRDTLDKKSLDVSPQPLPPGKAGAFSLRYEENSPFLYGYGIEFIDGGGALIPHLEGFNVR